MFSGYACPGQYVGPIYTEKVLGVALKVKWDWASVLSWPPELQGVFRNQSVREIRELRLKLHQAVFSL